jgi:rhomboid family protein
MLPLRDDAPRSTTPYVNYFLIALNVGIFFFQWSLQDTGGARTQNDFLTQFALVPQRFAAWKNGYVPAAAAFVPFVSSMFLHASWLHVLLNMWGLAIFGDNVEDRLGHFGYLIFYLICGLGAGVTHLLFNFNSRVPTVGASGAIAGVMGAYFVLYPRSRVLMWVPIFFLFEVPAVFFLGFWFLTQLLSGVTSGLASSGQVGGVAFWAHVAGFAAGALLVKVFARPERSQLEWWDAGRPV